jgi:hypothetical protein
MQDDHVEPSLLPPTIVGILLLLATVMVVAMIVAANLVQTP